ncbi:spore germination protein [Paenibacillus sp. IITD108]|uniref:spore germination protein n=1 Tax=Paenibacillus sp. IITD108 TaxID=3116649 RepID=UPI002F3E213A
MGSKLQSGRKTLRRKKQMPLIAKHEQEQEQEYAGVPLFDSITKNQEKIKQDLGDSRDVSIRKLILNDAAQNEFLIVYIDGIVSDESINKFIVEPLQIYANEDNSEKITPDLLRNRLVAISSVELISDWGIFYRYLFLCGCMVFINGFDTALFAKVPGGEGRGIEEPKTEMTIRGPKEGFTESLYTNMALIRKKLRSPKLWSEMWTIGKLSQTPVSMVYIKGLADEKVMQTLRERLEAIDIDGVLETNYIEELITDQKWTLFPTIINNERPDVIAGMLLEGRIIIMVDGSPFALIMPVSLNSFFQAAEDYYQRFDIATFLRLLRFISFFLALLMPSIYVAIVSYHQEMIPTPLLLKLAAQREGVPFPAYLEAFLMEFVFEILREAVLRMPIAAGNTVSIVGGLVIGQSIVEAGIVSPAVVIVVSFTAITSFVSPAYNLGIAARLLRFLLLLAASTLGFYGISLILLLLLLHLSHLRSIGMPYLKPFAPFLASDWKDSIIRAPLWKMKLRPQLLAGNNRQREQVQQPEEEQSNDQT